jgi:hypothetical protein
VSKVARKGLTVVLVAVVLGLLPLVASACGESKAVAQPSSSPATQPRLVDIGPFSLLSGRSTRVMLHATKSHPLRVFVLADRQLDSITLRHVGDTDGSLVPPEAVPLQGSPHASGKQTVYGLTTEPIEPGYYRLDLRGRGRILSLAVMDW